MDNAWNLLLQLSSLAVLILCAASARAGSRMFLLDDEGERENKRIISQTLYPACKLMEHADSLPRFRRDIPPQSSGVGAVVSPRAAGPPIFRPPSGGPIYSPVPPVEIDLAGAGSDSYGKGYGKPGKVSLLKEPN